MTTAPLSHVDREIAELEARLGELRAIKRRQRRAAKQRQRRQRPEVRAREAAAHARYMARPEVKLRTKLRAAGLPPEQIAAALEREARG